MELFGPVMGGLLRGRREVLHFFLQSHQLLLQLDDFRFLAGDVRLFNSLDDWRPIDYAAQHPLLAQIQPSSEGSAGRRILPRHGGLALPADDLQLLVEGPMDERHFLIGGRVLHCNCELKSLCLKVGVVIGEIIHGGSIGVGDSLGVVGRVEDGGVGPDFHAAGVFLEEVVGPLGVGELDQILEDVVGAGVGGLIPLLVAGVEVVGLEVLHALVGVSVELGVPVLVVDGVALVPLLETHGAHDVVVGHRVEAVKRVLNSLLGADAHLERRAHARPREALVVEDFVVLETPGLEAGRVVVFRLSDHVFFILLVEEEWLLQSEKYLVHQSEPVLQLCLLPHCVRPQLEVLVILREVLPCLTPLLPSWLKSQSSGAFTRTPFTNSGLFLLSASPQLIVNKSIINRHKQSQQEPDCLTLPKKPYLPKEKCSDLKIFDNWSCHSQICRYLVEMSSPEEQEERHKIQVKSAFANYTNDMKEEYFSLFGPPHATPFYRSNQERKAMMMEHAIKHNQQFLNQVLDYCNYVDFTENFTPDARTTANNRSKIKTTLKQCYREWCSESVQKEDYMILVEKCKKYLKKDDFVLVPGCGLGRLVVELLCGGFGVQGNQVTYFMLFASNYILNSTEKPNQFTIYPFIHSMSYYYNEEDIFRSVTIPDKALIEHVAEDANLAIVAGQFCQVYNERPGEFDGLVSCFFVDTANNIFHYVDTIRTTLKPGGIWVNFGPLLYHYREMLNEVSIQVSWETLKNYISEYFDFLEEWSSETTYCHDPRSEMSVVYNCIGFVCRRKA